MPSLSSQPSSQSIEEKEQLKRKDGIHTFVLRPNAIQKRKNATTSAAIHMLAKHGTGINFVKIPGQKKQQQQQQNRKSIR